MCSKLTIKTPEHLEIIYLLRSKVPRKTKSYYSLYSRVLESQTRVLTLEIFFCGFIPLNTMDTYSSLSNNVPHLQGRLPNGLSFEYCLV